MPPPRPYEMSMNNCCSNNEIKIFPRKQVCPINHNNYIQVPLKTVLHHVKNSWNTNFKEQGYYFCDDKNCDVVYFGEDNSIIKKSELRTIISSKTKQNDALICYCFGISRAEEKNNPAIKEFVIQQTKKGNCSCETSNPSGRCCLKDFPKI